MCLNKVGASVIHKSDGRGDRLASEEGGEGSEHGLSFRGGRPWRPLNPATSFTKCLAKEHIVFE